ncbi:hypothetical protein G4G28_11170 [Massilia sp. Dwa41.01b]|uniref:hypothetical protein n=1 Tax=unclassified Massilia TaxID=2609279 RepID=UPI001600DEBD|nr:MULTISPECIES: hypothetical protein [unclassified Massilia]QNA88908.1 hypothetical protein G4G28_11170 [Massilia sp. Dwa41.01b]QNA99799.1 hypothetical protein G4G31_14800 [Massilia sp. Se16.2.3]
MSELAPNLPFPIRTECPPGACVCERARLLADPGGDFRPLAIDRKQEQKLLARIERIDSYADLQHVQDLIRKNVGAELRIAPGPNEVRSMRGIIIVLEEKPGLCKKVRQSVAAAVRKRLQEKPEIAYAILDAGTLFGGT